MAKAEGAFELGVPKTDGAVVWLELVVAGANVDPKRPVEDVVVVPPNTLPVLADVADPNTLAVGAVDV